MNAPLDVDDPAVLAEVRAAFESYERALVSNDVAALDELFWRDPRTLRYGPTESLYGHDAIAAFRAARPTADLARDLTRVTITTFGRDFATANAEYRRRGSGRRGRQSQAWARIDGAWRVVAAHVSLEPPEAGS